MSVEARLRKFILQNYLFTDDESKLKNDDSFLQRGIVDSTGILEVIQYLQDEFAVKVEDAEMVPENLDSIKNLMAFLQRKKAA
jgi:acyl carrier protein